MSDTPPRFEVLSQLGGTAYRLPGRYAPVFLMPPDFRTYVAADAGARVLREYDLDTGDPVRVLLGPDDYDQTSRPSADGRRIAVETPGGLRVVDLAAGRAVFTLPPDPARVRFALAPSGDRLAVLIRHPDTEEREADGDMGDVYVSAVVVHDLGPGAARREFRPLANYGVLIDFSADGRLLSATGAWGEEYDDQPPPFAGEEMFQVWDVASGAEVFRLVPPDAGRGPYPAFGGEHVLINSGHYNRPFALYHLPTRALVHQYPDRYPGLEQAVLSPDGRVLAGVRSSGALVRWDAATGAELGTTPCPFAVTRSPSTVHDEFTKGIAFRADGAVVVLRVVGQSVEAWTALDGRPVTRAVGGAAAITAIGFTDDGRQVLTAGRGDPVVRRWDAGTGALLGQTDLPGAVAECGLGRIWFGPDERLVAMSRYGEAVIHLPARGLRLTPPVYEEASQGESLSADGWRVSLPTHYMSTSDTGVRVEHIIDGGRRELFRFDGTAAAAAYDRGRVVLVYDDRPGTQRTAVCLPVGPGRAEPLWSRSLPVGPEFRRSYRSGIDHARVNFSVGEGAVVWAPDGATVLVVPARERVPFLLDPHTGDTLSTWATAIGSPHAVHPSRPVLAAATDDGDGLILADWQTGAVLATVQERCYPHAVAWSPDGSRLVASLSDGTARVFGMG